MNPIQEAIEEIESRQLGEKSSYREVAKKFNIDRTTLSRRHQGKQLPNAVAGEEQRHLNPQQELELVRYIEEFTRHGLSPTREMLQNFASAVAKWEVSQTWVTRFLERHSGELTTKSSAGIDRGRHEADKKKRYEQYFALLHGKMREYKIEPRDTYNMDEKGFRVGSEREWVTLLACVCASGEALPPSLIYAGASGIQSSWVDDVEVGKHQVFFSNSPTGLSNDELDLAWFKQVFERYTRAKAGRRWRVLIVDNHCRHLTLKFIEACVDNRILLAILPHHSSHSLQPLDVVLFSPLSRAYTTQLGRRMQRSQAIARPTKDDFFINFWAAWSSIMKPELIMKSFEATGVWPMEADAVLKRFNNHPQRQDEDSGIREHSDGDSWRKLCKLLDAAVSDKSSVEAKRLSQTLHSLQVKNELLRDQIARLWQELDAKRLQRDAATAEKAHDRANTSKHKASTSAAKNPTKRRRVVGAASRVDAATEPPQKPAKKTHTRSTRSTRSSKRLAE